MVLPDHVHLVDANLFRADSGIGDDANRSAVSIRCPHCRELGSFDVVKTKAVRYHKLGKSERGGRNAIEYFASIRICPSVKCRGLVFVLEDMSGEVVEIEPPQLLDFNPDKLPPMCEKTLREAVACHAAGAYRAAAMMVRRLLEEICEDNSAVGQNLHQRLKSLRRLVVLPEPFFDAMDALKALGNDAAHVEAKAYDEIGPGEAEDSIELAKEVVKAIYQLKGLIERLQARKGATP
jgi:hypothetical protein